MTAQELAREYLWALAPWLVEIQSDLTLRAFEVREMRRRGYALVANDTRPWWANRRRA